MRSQREVVAFMERTVYRAGAKSSALRGGRFLEVGLRTSRLSATVNNGSGWQDDREDKEGLLAKLNHSDCRGTVTSLESHDWYTRIASVLECGQIIGVTAGIGSADSENGL